MKGAAQEGERSSMGSTNLGRSGWLEVEVQTLGRQRCLGRAEPGFGHGPRGGIHIRGVGELLLMSGGCPSLLNAKELLHRSLSTHS